MDKTFFILLEETRLARERAAEAAERLEAFSSRSTATSRRFTPDGIRGKGRHSDPTAHSVLGKIALEQNYRAAVDRLVECKCRLERDIDSDPMPDMKRVLYWRIICEHPWEEICSRLNARYTPRGLQRSIRTLIAADDQGRWQRMLQQAL